MDENKEVLKKYTELWNGIKNEIETINSGKKDEYGRDFMKIKFYPQLYLDDAELKNIAILNVKGVDFRCILWSISWDEVANRLNNFVLEDKVVI